MDRFDRQTTGSWMRPTPLLGRNETSISGEKESKDSHNQ